MDQNRGVTPNLLLNLWSLFCTLIIEELFVNVANCSMPVTSCELASDQWMLWDVSNDKSNAAQLHILPFLCDYFMQL